MVCGGRNPLYGSIGGRDMLPAQSREDRNVPTNNGASGDADRRIILFRPRTRALSDPAKTDSSRKLDAASPVSDLAKFEGGQDHDYRHRMIVNAAALAFTLVLAAAGIWIAESMAKIRKDQDCALIGRKNCSSIEVPARDRWSGTVSDRQ
jgi:hypothetical protein